MEKFRILVVEDDLNLQLIFHRFLVSNSYIVSLANNGQEAVKSFIDKKFPFDVIITDIMMPKLNGLELLQYVKSQEAYSKTKVVGITSGYMSYLESLSDYKFDAMLEKPLDMKILLDVIQGASLSSLSR